MGESQLDRCARAPRIPREPRPWWLLLSAVAVIWMPSFHSGPSSQTVFHGELQRIAATLDLDGDGRLSRWELSGEGWEDWLAAIGPGERALSPARWRQLLALDLAAEVREVFEIFDVDSSGDWSRSEIPRPYAERLLALDRNGDLRISELELQRLPQLPAFGPNELWVAEADAQERAAWLDGLLADGPVALTRLSETALEELRDYDFDRDGQLSRTEIERGERLLEAPARFRVEGDVAYLYGLLTSDLNRKFERLLKRFPDLRVLELVFVPGTIDQEVVFEVAGKLHARGLITRVPPGGMVASGGVTLLASGRGRRVGAGARIGVHSWSYRLAGMDLDGRDHPRSSGEHTSTLSIYRELGIPAGLYWFELLASDSWGLHWMTRTELDRYGFGR